MPCGISRTKEFHIDRGDAQRAAEYYAELAVKISLAIACRLLFLLSSVLGQNGANEKNGNLISFTVLYMDLALKYEEFSFENHS